MLVEYLIEKRMEEKEGDEKKAKAASDESTTKQ
jgi:hypothetical protein